MVCREADAWAVEARAAHEGLLARQWWARTWAPAIKAAGSNVARAEIRRRALADKVARVESGELAFSRNDVLRRELGTILRVIEWDRRRWKEIPEGLASRAGRRWGSRNAAAVGEVFDCHVHVDVSDEVGEMVRRGCFWTSEEASEKLRRWYDRHGRGPAGANDLPEGLRGLYLLVMMLKGMPSAEDMSDRDGWRAAVITPGDILRRAIVAAGAGYEPPEPPEDD